MPADRVSSGQPRQPKYRLHKPTGRAVVTLNGKDHYLGVFGSPESHEAYRRKIAEWFAAGGPEGLPVRSARELSICDLAQAYWRSLEQREADKVARGAHDRVKLALAALVALYGAASSNDFGPKALRVLQRHMVNDGLSRGVINQRIQFIKRAVRWAVAEELVQPGLSHALEAVENLRRGEFGVREGRRVLPVAEQQVWEILPQVSRQVAAMIELMWWSGMRPGEAIQLRPCDLERGTKLWTYRPRRHKTEHHGKVREIQLGPRAQEVLRRLLDRVPSPPADKPLFSPKEAEAEHAKKRRAERITPLRHQHLLRRHRDRPTRELGDAYTVASYRRAIERGVQAANAIRVRERVVAIASQIAPEVAVAKLARCADRLAYECFVSTRGKLNVDRDSLLAAFARVLSPAQARETVQRLGEPGTKLELIPYWHPNQLRHSAATRIRREADAETARVVLGHSSLAITEVYAEVDQSKARSIMERCG